MLVTAHRQAASHRRAAPSGVDYCYDGYPNGAAATVQHVTPITVLQQVPNRQPMQTNVPHWVDPTLEQGVGRDSTFKNGWMKKAYVSDYSRLMISSSQWAAVRAETPKQHAPSTGHIQLAARVNRSRIRFGNLAAPVTVAYTAAGGEPL
jgi:hypothetical protein